MSSLDPSTCILFRYSGQRIHGNPVGIMMLPWKTLGIQEFCKDFSRIHQSGPRPIEIVVAIGYINPVALQRPHPFQPGRSFSSAASSIVLEIEKPQGIRMITSGSASQSSFHPITLEAHLCYPTKPSPRTAPPVQESNGLQPSAVPSIQDKAPWDTQSMQEVFLQIMQTLLTPYVEFYSTVRDFKHLRHPSHILSHLLECPWMQRNQTRMFFRPAGQCYFHILQAHCADLTLRMCKNPIRCSVRISFMSTSYTDKPRYSRSRTLVSISPLLTFVGKRAEVRTGSLFSLIG